LFEILQNRPALSTIFQVIPNLFQSLAARVQAWLVPGTVLEPTGEGLYLTAFVLNPAGEIFGHQRKLDLTGAEASWGVVPGNSVQNFGTEIGELAILIGEDLDAVRGQTARNAGANVLLHPTAESASKIDLRAIVAATNVFGVQAKLVGGGHSGRSGIYAPTALTSGGDGVLAVAEDNSDLVLVAHLALDGLNVLRSGETLK